LDHHLGQGQLATLGHGGFHSLADGDHEADHVVAWEVDDLGYRVVSAGAPGRQDC
jgi:hypothetical protein